MGLLGIGVGAITVFVGIAKNDPKLIKKGLKREALGVATMLMGDAIGVSDSVDVVTSLTDANST